MKNCNGADNEISAAWLSSKFCDFVVAKHFLQLLTRFPLPFADKNYVLLSCELVLAFIRNILNQTNGFASLKSSTQSWMFRNLFSTDFHQALTLKSKLTEKAKVIECDFCKQAPGRCIVMGNCVQYRRKKKLIVEWKHKRFISKPNISQDSPDRSEDNERKKWKLEVALAVEFPQTMME